MILGYAKQALKFFLVDPDTIMDVVSSYTTTNICLLRNYTLMTKVWTDSR